MTAHAACQKKNENEKMDGAAATPEPKTRRKRWMHGEGGWAEELTARGKWGGTQNRQVALASRFQEMPEVQRQWTRRGKKGREGGRGAVPTRSVGVVGWEAAGRSRRTL